MREKRMGYTAMWAAILGAWFSLIFYGADWFAACHPRRVPPHFAWELRLPFLPALASIYITTNLVIGLAPAVLTTRREIRALALALCADILIAGIAFILYPAELAFPPPDAGQWVLFRFADMINGTYNLVPSLHVALTVTCVSAYAFRAKVFWWLWAALIAVSTLFTHQHHVIDVASGWLLGIAGGRLYNGINQSHV